MLLLGGAIGHSVASRAIERPMERPIMERYTVRVGYWTERRRGMGEMREKWEISTERRGMQR